METDGKNQDYDNWQLNMTRLQDDLNYGKDRLNTVQQDNEKLRFDLEEKSKSEL